MSGDPAQTPDGDRPGEGFGRRLENLLLGIALFGMIGLAGAQVLLRGLGGQAFGWGDEALRLLVLWSAMLGAVAASRDDTHLRIDALARSLAPVPKALVAALVDLFTAGVAIVLTWYSFVFVRNAWEFGDELLGGLPAWPFQAILPAAFALIAWRYLVWTIRRLRSALRGGRGA